ncbi:MAG TPA: metallophosphoesterase [Nitrososphaeraceae archaeon]
MFSIIFIITSLVFPYFPVNPTQGVTSSVQLTDNNGASYIQNFNFAVTGDFGCGDEAKKTVSNIKSKNPELVILTGDLSYQKNATCWFNTVAPLEVNNKLKIAFGEHDIDSNLTKYNDYMKHFNLSKPYYSFDYQNVHFLVMATAKNEVVPYLNGSDQYKFVKSDLKKAHRDTEIDWIIVDTFRPLYSSNTTHPGLDKLQDIYHPLFEKYGVDIVLQGHNHNYQRTYPLSYNQSMPFSPIVTDRHTRDYDNNPKGQIFFTVGTAGEDLYNLTKQAPYVVTQFLRHGFLNVNLINNGTNLTATFYENRDMKEKDHLSFVKMHKPKI